MADFNASTYLAQVQEANKANDITAGLAGNNINTLQNHPMGVSVGAVASGYNTSLATQGMANQALMRYLAMSDKLRGASDQLEEAKAKEQIDKNQNDYEVQQKYLPSINEGAKSLQQLALRQAQLSQLSAKTDAEWQQMVTAHPFGDNSIEGFNNYNRLLAQRETNANLQKTLTEQTSAINSNMDQLKNALTTQQSLVTKTELNNAKNTTIATMLYNKYISGQKINSGDLDEIAKKANVDRATVESANSLVSAQGTAANLSLARMQAIVGQAQVLAVAKTNQAENTGKYLETTQRIEYTKQQLANEGLQKQINAQKLQAAKGETAKQTADTAVAQIKAAQAAGDELHNGQLAQFTNQMYGTKLTAETVRQVMNGNSVIDSDTRNKIITANQHMVQHDAVGNYDKLVTNQQLRLPGADDQMEIGRRIYAAQQNGEYETLMATLKKQGQITIENPNGGTPLTFDGVTSPTEVAKAFDLTGNPSSAKGKEKFNTAYTVYSNNISHKDATPALREGYFSLADPRNLDGSGHQTFDTVNMTVAKDRPKLKIKNIDIMNMAPITYEVNASTDGVKIEHDIGTLLGTIRQRTVGPITDDLLKSVATDFSNVYNLGLLPEAQQNSFAANLQGVSFQVEAPDKSVQSIDVTNAAQVYRYMKMMYDSQNYSMQSPANTSEAQSSWATMTGQ